MALLLRLGALLAIEPTRLGGDENDYYNRGLRLSEEGRFGEGWKGIGGRVPATEIFYAFLFECFGTDVSVARLGNISVSVLTLLPIFFLGCRLGATRCGLTSAALAAVYPNFIAFSHFLWSESLFIFLAASSLAILAWYSERAALWKLMLAAAVLALACLTRAMGASFALAVVCWLAWTQRGEWKRALASISVFGLVLAALLAPWLVYVNRHNDRLVLMVKEPSNYYYFLHVAPSELEGRPASEQLRSALREIAEALPRRPLEKIAAHVPGFFTPNSFAVSRLLREPKKGDSWAYRFSWKSLDRRAARIGAAVVTVALYVVVAVLGIGGLVLAPGRRFANLYILFALSQLVTTVLFFAISRFRLPSMVVLIVGAAALLSGGREAWSLASPERRRATVVAMVLILALMATRFQDVLGSHWT